MIKNPGKFVVIYFIANVVVIFVVALPMSRVWQANQALALVNGVFWGIVAGIITIAIDRATD